MTRLIAQEIVALTVGWIAACFLHPAPLEARAIAVAGLLAIGALRHVSGLLRPGAIVAGGFLLCTVVAGFPAASGGGTSRFGDEKADLLVEGTVIDGPRDGPHGAGFILRLERVDEQSVSPVEVRLWSPWPEEARAGDVVESFARCARFGPREFPDLPSARTRWSRRGLAGRCTAQEPIAVRRRGRTLRGVLAARRLAMEQTLARMEGPAAGVAIAMLTGTRGFVSEETRAAFIDTGTGHLLAISGLHFGMLAALVWSLVGLLLRRSVRIARRFGVRRASAFVVAATMAGYLVLVGAPTSASRAWVVVAFAAAGLLVFRRPSGFAALAAAALLLTVGVPTMVHDLGFQLSFCATGAIVLFWWRRPGPVDFDPYAFERSAWRERLRRVGAFVLMSWCATAVTWPLLLGATGRISLIALLVNPVVVPWIGGVIFPLLIVTAAVASFFEPATCLLVIPQTLLNATIQVLEQCAAVPHATWCPGVPPTGFVVVGVLAVLGAIAARMRPRALITAFAVVGAMVAQLELSTPPATLRVHFIPVGQGDATLVEFPDGRRLLIDAGGSRFGRDPGRFVVVPYLWRRGIEKLDALVVTHDDIDHSGGVPGVLAEIEVDRVLRDPSELGVPGLALQRLTEEGSSNERSVVATVRQMHATVLLTGDIERAAELAWLRAPERITLLKVPHHGSLTSSSPEFVDAADPLIAVVSAGRHNRFGHPHPRVVQRYEARAIPLYSTSKNGLVRVEFSADGTLEVRTVR